MQVRSKIIRQGGTTVDLLGKTYFFAPNDKGDHVCTVTDPAALSRLVNEIPQGFELYGSDADKTVPTVLQPLKPASPTSKSKPQDHLLIKDANGVEVDLKAMSDEDLRIFAASEFGVEVNAKAKPEQIHSKILEAIRVLNQE